MSYNRGAPNIDGMTSLKVDNLTYRTTPEDLKRVFEKYGDVGDVYIPRHPYTRESRGFAFVRFYDNRDAEDAMYSLDGYVLDGRELRVQMARYGRPNESRRSARSFRDRYDRDRERRHRSASRSRSRSRRSYSRRSRSHSKPHSRRQRSSSRSNSRSRSHHHADEDRRSHSKSLKGSKAHSKSKSRSRSQSQNGERKSGSRSQTPRRSVSRSRSQSPHARDEYAKKSDRSRSPSAEDDQE